MNNGPSPYSEGSDGWCRWAWLSSRTEEVLADRLISVLGEIVIDSGRDGDVRRTALQAYWMGTGVRDAVKLESHLIDQKEIALASVGLQHPRWWKDETWILACNAWRGVDTEIDEAIARLWSWSNRPMAIIRIPQEVTERAALTDMSSIDWERAMTVGVDRAGVPSGSPFETFWRGHIMDWAHRWLLWEESVWLYQWRLREEATLTAWTDSAAYRSSWPDLPGVHTLEVPDPRQSRESLYLTMLGLGYLLGQDTSSTSAAAWDGIWSSWSASLNYAIFEVQSNVQTTEWHIGGLAGALRDNYALKRRGGPRE